MEFPLLEACLPVYSFVDIDLIMPACKDIFDIFHPLSCDVLSSFIRKLSKTTCVLDQFLTKLLMSPLSSILDIILCIVNLWFSRSPANMSAAWRGKRGVEMFFMAVVNRGVCREGLIDTVFPQSPQC